MDTLIGMSTPSDLERVESRIIELVRNHLSVPATDIAESCRPVLHEVVEQAVTSSEGGKRLRARLAIAAFDAIRPHAGPETHDAMVDLACAIEVFQTAALVHDDIIDESDLRRGKPSAHRALAEATHSTAIGRGLGLMLGDILATMSIAIAEHAASCLHHPHALDSAFLHMQRDVSVGQVLDLAVELNPLDNPTQLDDASLNVFRWKTASYTTMAPLQLGLTAAGIDPNRAAELAERIGRPVGVAFQLADDLLDVIGYTKATGKPVGGDIKEGKRSVLLADALTLSDAPARDELIAMYEALQRDAQDVRRGIEIFTGCGAVDRSRERISALWNEARTAIASSGLDHDAQQTLIKACRMFIPDSCL